MKFQHSKHSDLSFSRVKDFVPQEFLNLLSESDREAQIAMHFTGQGGLALMEIIEDPNGSATLHSHDQEEIFYVLEGELLFGKRVCKAGDSINIKAGTQYTFKTGAQGCRYLKFTASADNSFNLAGEGFSPDRSKDNKQNTAKAETVPCDIRPETHADYFAIRSITEQAFRNVPYAGGDEQKIIERLRFANALTLSLVATIDNELVGHIAFSPAIAGDSSGPWFTLGPLSVLPEYQCKGIGAQLIERGLEEISKLGPLGCILTGNPFYYSRFGFEVTPQNAPETVPGEYFLIKLFESVKPTGKFRFHRAFYGEL